MTLIRKPTVEDAKELFSFEKENGEFIRRYFSIPEFKSVEESRDLIETHLEQPNRLSYWILAEGEEIVGSVELTHIRKGGFCSANLNYYLGKQFTGKGLATQSVRKILDIAFKDLGLNRIEAFAHQANKKSIGVLERVGFEFEGLMREYLKIGDEWHDHGRWACIASDHLNRSKKEHS